MDILKQKLNQLIEELSENKKEVIKNRLHDLVSVYPFNEYEYIISSLMGLYCHRKFRPLPKIRL